MKPRDQWRATQFGPGPLSWIITRMNPLAREGTEQHRNSRGRLVRYSSHSSAKTKADQLNSVAKPTVEEAAAQAFPANSEAQEAFIFGAAWREVQ